MTDQVLFYWFSWFFWVIITFFMKKNQKRIYLAGWILVVVIFSNYYIEWQMITISFPIILLFFGAVILLGNYQKWFYHLAASFVTAIGYAAFLFWETISPVWLILPRNILITVIFGLIISILAKNYVVRIAICLFGMTSGEVIYRYILASYGFPVTIGDKAALVSLFVVVLFFTFINLLQKGKYKLLTGLEKHKEKMMEVAK